MPSGTFLIHFPIMSILPAAQSRMNFSVVDEKCQVRRRRCCRRRDAVEGALRRREWICASTFDTIICFALSAAPRTNAIAGSDWFASVNPASSEYFFRVSEMTFSWKWQGLICAGLWLRSWAALQIKIQAH